MDCTGKIKSLSIDFISGKLIAEIEVNEKVPEQLEKLSRLDKLSIQLKKFRKKRSLDANAYFHVLVTKIADANSTSIDECKNILLSRYGQYEFIDDKIPTYLIKSQYWMNMTRQSSIHFKLVGHEVLDHEEYCRCAVMRGSHTYNTKEMAQLIDGTVQEAKDLGIETATPDQLIEMKRRWHIE